MPYQYAYEHRFVLGNTDDRWIIRPCRVCNVTDTQAHLEVWRACENEPARVICLELQALFAGDAEHSDHPQSFFSLSPLPMDAMAALATEDQRILHSRLEDQVYHRLAQEFYQKGDDLLRDYLMDMGIANVDDVMQAHAPDPELEDS